MISIVTQIRPIIHIDTSPERISKICRVACKTFYLSAAAAVSTTPTRTSPKTTRHSLGNDTSSHALQANSIQALQTNSSQTHVPQANSGQSHIPQLNSYSTTRRQSVMNLSSLVTLQTSPTIATTILPNTLSSYPSPPMKNAPLPSAISHPVSSTSWDRFHDEWERNNVVLVGQFKELSMYELY